MTLRVVLAEDEPMARQRFARQLREAGCEVLAEFSGGEALVGWFRGGGSADALFLDIQMPGLTGLESLAEIPDPPPTVFVTAHVHYALQAFESAAVDYLLKPVHEDRLRRTLDRLEAQLIPRRKASELCALTQGTRFPARAGEGFVFLDLRKVSHFEVEDEMVHAVAGGERFRTTWTALSEVEASFPGESFLRIHRHILLRPSMVVAFKPLLGGRGEVKVQGNLNLPVSRSSVPRVRTLLGLPGLAAGRL